MEVQVSALIDIQLASRFNHGAQLRTLIRAFGSIARLSTFRYIFDVGSLLFLNCYIRVWVLQVNVREYCSKQSFSSMEAYFQGLDILWSGISSSIRGLIIGTICWALA